MIYPSDFEHKIGFDRIRRQISEMCSMRAAVGLLDRRGFMTSPQEVAASVEACDQMRVIVSFEAGFPSEEFTDIDDIIEKLAVDGTFLETDELRSLRAALDSACRILDFLSGERGGRYPRLAAMCSEVNGFAEIINHIDTIVDRFGEVRDSASPELYEIRRQIRSSEGEAAKRLRGVLSRAQSDGVVDAEAQISIRDGRAVIPVAAANKRKLPGFIHDQSATGRTFYIEPVEVVEINNRLKELEYAERREVVRILTEFAASIRPQAEEIARTGDFLARMDLLRAEGRWCAANECVKPIMSKDGTLLLRRAVHPLLAQTLSREGKSVVPLDMHLSPSERILVISGPNAGGKSVCLKSVGLIQYMYQCGLCVPVLENSELPVFGSVFIDIGDQQSIDNDLSTYSSHLLNMRNILSGAGADSLVLIDEFGSGTEPVIGGAIAEAILERLVERGVYGVITTHYANIKYFASTADGVVNGAMMFDVQNIKPLFRLETGKPGSSFAVEIARKMGLPEDIIRSASEKAGSDHINIEKQLREIARDKRYWEQKRDRIRLTDKKVEQLEQDYAERLEKLRSERAQIIKNAKLEAQRLVAEANREIENTIRSIRQSQAEKEQTRLVRRKLDEFNEKMSGAEDSERQQHIEREMERVARRQDRRRQKKENTVPVTEQARPSPLPLGVGCKVRVKGRDEVVGEVLAVKGGKATVGFGQIVSQVAVDRLEVISNSEYKESTRPVRPRTVVSVDISQRKLNFKSNADVRGMRAAEALEVVRNLVDDALMLGVQSVSILHGKGTGALKEEIRRYLRTVDAVQSVEDEHVQMGGAGISVVRFKD